MNSTGKPDTAVKDGRKAIWVATRENALVPVQGWEFLFFQQCAEIVFGNLGGTARSEKLVPWDSFSFCFPGKDDIMKRIYNFNAGPSAMPLEVLEEARAEFTNYRHTGMSIIEISHRSAEYQEMHD